MTSNWFKDARERVISGAVYLAGALATVQGLVVMTPWLQEPWEQVTTFGAVAVALNVIKVLAAKKVGDPETAGLHRAPAVEGDGASFRCGAAECHASANDDTDATK